MGREGDQAYMTGSSNSRWRRLPVILMLLTILVATAVAIGVALGGDKAGAAPATTGATIKATPFQVGGKPDQ
jgi:hypothetical protein